MFSKLLRERREKLMAEVQQIDAIVDLGVTVRTDRFSRETYHFETVPDDAEFDVEARNSCGCCPDPAVQLRFFTTRGGVRIYHVLDRITIGSGDVDFFDESTSWLPRIASIKLSAQGQKDIDGFKSRSLDFINPDELTDDEDTESP